MIFDGFFKTRKLYLLLVVPLLLVLFILSGHYLNIALPASPESGTLISFDFFRNINPEYIKWYKGGILLALFYLIVYTSLKYTVLINSSSLPGLLYVLMSAGVIFLSTDLYIWISAICFVIAFINLQGAIYNSYSNAYIFNLGFFLSQSVLFYPKLVLLLLWAFIVMFFTGRSTLKDILALIIGIGTTGGLFFTYKFLSDGTGSFFPDFLYAVTRVYREVDMAPHNWIILSIFILLFLLMQKVVLKSYSSAIVNQRRAASTLWSLLLFLVLTLVLVPGTYFELILFIAVPLSYCFSQYFIFQNTRYWADMLFILFLLACAGLYVF